MCVRGCIVVVGCSWLCLLQSQQWLWFGGVSGSVGSGCVCGGGCMGVCLSVLYEM